MFYVYVQLFGYDRTLSNLYVDKCSIIVTPAFHDLCGSKTPCLALLIAILIHLDIIQRFLKKTMHMREERVQISREAALGKRMTLKREEKAQ